MGEHWFFAPVGWAAVAVMLMPSLITVTVTDGFDNPVPDGTVVVLSTTLGHIEPRTGRTVDGQVTATLISGEAPGQAVVQAVADSAVGSTPVMFHPADVSIIKRIQPSGEVEPGQIVTYTLTFQNEELAVARAVTITDQLPEQLIEASFISSGVPITVAATPRPNRHLSLERDALPSRQSNASRWTWYVGDLPPGSGGIITITARLDPAYPWHTSESLFNAASISTVTPEGDYNNNWNGALATVITSDLYVIKELNSNRTLFSPGAVVRYDITVGNYGPALPRNVVITDTLPEHTIWSFDTSSQEGFSRYLEDGSVHWTTDVLTHSKQIILWIEVEEDAPGGAALINRAEVATSTADSDLSSNQAQAKRATVHALNLDVSNDVAHKAEPGQVLTYTITYRNVGTLPTPGAVLTDVLSPQVSFLRADPAPSSGGAGTHVWALGELRAGAIGSIELVGRVASDIAIGSVLTNTVTISATTGESYEGDNWTQATTTVVVGKPHTITVVAEPEAVSVVGPSASITATVKDAWDNAVEDGTLVELASTLGTITPAATATTRGVVAVVLDPGTVSGAADVTASAGGVTGTTQVTIRPGPAAVMALHAEPASLTVEDAAIITLTAQDQYANAVEDGTPVTLTTTLGVITPTLTATTDSAATATLKSALPGRALVTATVQSLVTKTVAVTIHPGAPFTLTLVADPPSIEVGGASTVITATVRDRFGNAVADGHVVTFATDLGTIDGAQVYTTTTSSGRAWAVLTSDKLRGTATVRVHVSGLVGEIGVPFTGYGYRIHLPLALKKYDQGR